MRIKILCVALVVVQAITLAIAAQGAETAAPTDADVSQATMLLFQTPHLQDIARPTVLRYGFERQAKDEDGFADHIDVKIDAIRDDGRRDVSFAFFTGARARPYPALSNFSGNPVVIVFLQREVWALSRKIGGLARYFRYRIRLALRSNATVGNETIETEHGVLQAHKITIKPYENDRHRALLGPYEFTTYEFVVSPDVPGGIYSIKTTVPAGEKDAAPLVRETVVFNEQQDHPGATDSQ